MTPLCSPLNVRCSKQGALWLALDGGKPIYIPPNTQINYSPWLMHRRIDLWGPTGMFIMHSHRANVIPDALSQRSNTTRTASSMIGSRRTWFLTPSFSSPSTPAPASALASSSLITRLPSS